MNPNQPKVKFYNVSSHLKINNERPQIQQQVQQPQQQKAVIERGASWSFSETKILLSLWSQDIIQRQLTNSKRTRHVWEKIAEKIKEFGYSRTPDQVRTRVFNMIAEYRRIKRNPTEEKIKKCTFFYSLQEVLEPNINGIRTALNTNADEYRIEFNNNDENDENLSNNELVMDNSREPSELDDKEVFSYTMSPSNFNQSLNTSFNSNFNRQHHNSQPNSSRTNSLNGIDSDYSQHSFSELQYTNCLNKKRQSNETFNFQNRKRTKFSNDYDELDNSNGITMELLERLIAHLAKSNESMLEWIKLEQIRLENEKIRRKEDDAREKRKEKKFLEALLTIQNSMFNFLKNQSNDTIDDYTMKLREKLNLISENTDKQDENNDKTTELIDKQKNSNHEQNLDKQENSDQQNVDQESIDEQNSYRYQNDDHQNLCQQQNNDTITKEDSSNKNIISNQDINESPKEQKIKIFKIGSSLLASSNSNKNRQTVIETTTRINQQQKNEQLEELQNQHNYCQNSNDQQELEESVLEFEIINQEEIIDNTYDNFNFTNVQHEEIVE